MKQTPVDLPRATARLHVPAQRAQGGSAPDSEPDSTPPLHRVAEYAATHYRPHRADRPVPSVWAAALLMVVLYAILGVYSIAVVAEGGVWASSPAASR
jgi:hypothetical protein